MPVKHVRVAVTHGLGSQAGMLGFCHPLADGRLFAGIRPDETLRLDWEDIDFERRQIDLPAKKTKGRTRRIIPMEPNLIAWLKPYRPESGKGKICVNL